MVIFDISEPISPATAVWPGDTPFSRDWVMAMDHGQSCNVSTIHMSVHCGTHSDAPLHFLPGAAAIDRVPLDSYLGSCRVVSVLATQDASTGSQAVIPVDAFAALGDCRRVLFRTKAQHDATSFDEAFCCVGPAAAAEAVARGLLLVGIDTPSMDPFSSTSMETHRTLLSGGVAILENLDLSQVADGEYELIALPLKLVGGDASPVRAILRTLAGHEDQSRGPRT